MMLMASAIGFIGGPRGVSQNVSKSILLSLSIAKIFNGMVSLHFRLLCSQERVGVFLAYFVVIWSSSGVFLAFSHSTFKH